MHSSVSESTPPPTQPTGSGTATRAIITLLMVTGLSTAPAKEVAQTNPAFAKVLDSKEWVYEIAKAPTIGIATSLLNAVMVSTAFANRTVTLDQGSLDKIRDIVGHELDRNSYNQALATYAGLVQRISTYRRNRDPQFWNTDKNELNDILSQMWICLVNFDKAGYVSTPFFMDCSTLYANTAFEYLLLVALQDGGTSAQTALKLTFQPRFVWMYKVLQNRIDWAYTSVNWINLHANVKWEYRSSKAKYRGYYTPKVLGPNGGVMWESDTQFSTGLTYSWDRSGYTPPNLGQYQVHVDNARNQFLDFNRMGIHDKLKKQLVAFSGMSCARENYSNMSQFFGGFNQGQQGAGVITSPNPSQNGHLIYGPYQSFPYDIAHPVFMGRITRLEGYYTSYGPSIVGLDHNSARTWRSQVLATPNLDALVSYTGNFALFGTNSIESYRGDPQEFRVYLYGNYPNTTLEFREFKLVGFTYGRDDDHPAPILPVPTEWGLAANG